MWYTGCQTIRGYSAAVDLISGAFFASFIGVGRWIRFWHDTGHLCVLKLHCSERRRNIFTFLLCLRWNEFNLTLLLHCWFFNTPSDGRTGLTKARLIDALDGKTFHGTSSHSTNCKRKAENKPARSDHNWWSHFHKLWVLRNFQTNESSK